MDVVGHHDKRIYFDVGGTAGQSWEPEGRDRLLSKSPAPRLKAIVAAWTAWEMISARNKRNPTFAAKDQRRLLRYRS